MVRTDDERFTVALYTLAGAARALGVPTSTFATWALGYTRTPPDRQPVVGEPIVTSIRGEDGRRSPIVPFVGLVEGMVLAAIRKRGVPLQRIRPALKVLTESIGLEHALASRVLYTDGAEILYDFAEEAGDSPTARGARELVVVRSGSSPRWWRTTCTGSSTRRMATRA
jgi:hypothetical protein